MSTDTWTVGSTFAERPVRRAPVLAAALLVAIACGGERSSRAAAPVERDSAGVRFVESGAPRVAEAGGATAFALDAEPRLSIGVEEGEEAYQLHRVSDALRLADGRIAISNSGSNEIRVFDAAGSYLKSVGRKGEGPGEFGDFSSPTLHVLKDGFLATDDGAQRVHLLKDDLEFNETRRFTLTNETPRPFLRGVFADGSWLATATDGGGNLGGAPGTVIGLGVAILRYDENGVPAGTLGRYDGAKRFVNAVGDVTHYPFLPLTSESMIGISGDQLVVMRGDKPELEYHDLSGRLVRVVRWPRERVKSSRIWPEYRDRSIAGLATADERTRRLYGAYYAKELPLPEFAPLYSAMRIDSERSVWLQRFRMPGDTAARVWDVIAADGAWLGVVRTPPRLTAYRIGTDFMLGRSVDSLGVERVQLFGLRRAGAP